MKDDLLTSLHSQQGTPGKGGKKSIRTRLPKPTGRD